jgi:hypothetical protein
MRLLSYLWFVFFGICVIVCGLLFISSVMEVLPIYRVANIRKMKINPAVV